MSRLAIEPLPPATLPIIGSNEVFPVGRIICIGRNYAEHAVEMGHDPEREPPFFFFKSASCLTSDAAIPYPPQTRELHHEVELVVALGKGGRDIDENCTSGLIFGYGVGLDLTRRDLQAQAKKLGRPWELGKSFDFSAPCGPLTLAASVEHPERGTIELSVNGERRQKGDMSDMIWSVPEMLSILSHSFALRPGDIIMTGTPSGVGEIGPGDRLHAHIEGLTDLDVTIVS